MNYNKKFMIAIIAIITIQSPIQSALRRTTASLSYLTEPLRPIIKGHIQRAHDLPLMKEIRQHFTSARYAAEKLYAPFTHPLYTEFVEPQYVGHKAPIYYRQIHDQWDNLMMNEHEKFTKNQYLKWKRSVGFDPALEHQKAIDEYENAYINYRKNPKNPEIHKELLTQTQRIHEMITHDQAQQHKGIKERMLDAVYR